MRVGLALYHFLPSAMAAACTACAALFLWRDELQVSTRVRLLLEFLADAADVEIALLFLIPACVFVFVSWVGSLRRWRAAGRLPGHRVGGPSADRTGEAQLPPATLERLRGVIERLRPARERELLAVARRRATVRVAQVLAVYLALVGLLVGVPWILLRIHHPLYRMLPGALATLGLAFLGAWLFDVVPEHLTGAAAVQRIFAAAAVGPGPRAARAPGELVGNQGLVRWLDTYWPHGHAPPLYRGGIGVLLEVHGVAACLYTDASGEAPIHCLVAYLRPSASAASEPAALSGGADAVLEGLSERWPREESESPRDWETAPARLSWVTDATLTETPAGAALVIAASCVREQRRAAALDGETFFTALLRRRVRRAVRQRWNALVEQRARDLQTVLGLLARFARDTAALPTPPLR